MIWAKIVSIGKSFLSLSVSEKWFVFCAMGCGFCITMDYAIVRPVGNSLFIHAYGAQIFPYAWLAVLPLNALVISLYNYFLPRLGCYKMFLLIVLTIMGVNLFSGLFLQKIFVLPFLFYCWKEVYVMLMFQQLWSVIHSTISTDKAKYLYGLFFAMGGLGGMLGSIIPGFCAVKMGSEGLLFIAIPVYAILALLFYQVVKKSEQIRGETHFSENSKKQKTSILDGMKMIKSSPLLKFILCIVILMQLIATIVDYQFNQALQSAVSEKDLRTEYAGRILGIVNMATVVFQFIGAFLLVHLMGLKRSHFFVPAVLGVCVMGSLMFPVFGLFAFSYIAVKSFDFSLFGVIKEMLYIPCGVDQKFRAKSVIDVFAYRTAKAFGSMIILFFQFVAASTIMPILTWTLVGIFAVWLLAVAKMFKSYDNAFVLDELK